jgi:hypothetical protein
MMIAPSLGLKRTAASCDTADQRFEQECGLLRLRGHNCASSPLRLGVDDSDIHRTALTGLKDLCRFKPFILPEWVWAPNTRRCDRAVISTVVDRLIMHVWRSIPGLLGEHRCRAGSE